jgi:hypothetical protein
LIFSRQPLFIFDAFRRWLPLADDDIFDISSADTLSPMFSRFSFLYRMLAAYCHAADILLLILMPLAIRHAISRSASRHATPFYAAAACRRFCRKQRQYFDALRATPCAAATPPLPASGGAAMFTPFYGLPFFTPGCHARRDAAIAPARRAICRATPPPSAPRCRWPLCRRWMPPRRRAKRVTPCRCPPPPAPRRFICRHAILLLLLLRRLRLIIFIDAFFSISSTFSLLSAISLADAAEAARCLRCWLIYAADSLRFTRAGEGAAPFSRCAIGALHAAIDAILISAHAAYACHAAAPRHATPAAASAEQSCRAAP